MGVNHGDGDESPQEFGVRDANANCPPPDFVVFQNSKHQIASSRIPARFTPLKM